MRTRINVACELNPPGISGKSFFDSKRILSHSREYNKSESSKTFFILVSVLAILLSLSYVSIENSSHCII